jgi:hypothetical protein
MEKIIFLDFDGVLNTEYNQRLLLYQGKAWQDEHGAVFDPEAIGQLKRIIDVTKADIVIESSWKYFGLEAMQEMWMARQMPGRVIDITPSFDNNCKGIEIESWLSLHATPETRYVIIDDEYIVLESQLPFFILTNPYDGITDEVADKAISILNR